MYIKLLSIRLIVFEETLFQILLQLYGYFFVSKNGDRP